MIRAATKLLGVMGQVQFCTVTDTHEEQPPGKPAQASGQ